jgi:hypothetical protein
MPPFGKLTPLADSPGVNTRQSSSSPLCCAQLMKPSQVPLGSPLEQLAAIQAYEQVKDPDAVEAMRVQRIG